MTLNANVARLLTVIADKKSKKADRFSALQELDQALVGKRVPADFQTVLDQLRDELTPKTKDGVTAYIKRVLITDTAGVYSWDDIVAMCHEKFDCETTNKSVASIARDLRKAGFAIPHRTPTSKSAALAASMIAMVGDMEDEFEDESEDETAE